jgi:hypothetical protein
MAFFEMPWPPGPELAGGGRKEELEAGVGHRGVRETGVEVMDVDVRECESCEAEGGGPRLALRRREGNTQSLLSLRLRRPHPRVMSATAPPPTLLELGI